MSSTGMDPRFGKCPRSHRLSRPTGKGLGGGFRSVVRATLTLSSDTCQDRRGESILFDRGVVGERGKTAWRYSNVEFVSLFGLVVKGSLA